MFSNMNSTDYLYENKPMSQFKNFIMLIVYIYSLNSIVNKESILAIVIFAAITIIHIIKFIRLKDYTNNFSHILKQKLSLQREEFVNSLSHDLRIPIIAHLRALELLSNEKMGNLNTVQKDMLSQISQSCKCELNLISLLINIYNMENNKLKLMYEKFNISDVIINCFDELLQEAKEKNITFEYSGIRNNLNIVADKTEIKKVILNLIVSSVIHSNYGGKVTVNLKTIGNKIQLSIHGEETNQNLISTNSQYNSIGQGIRMHFCKKIIETHNGHFLNNKFNSFKFELPIFNAL